MIRDELGRIYTVTQAEWDRVLHEKNQALIQIWDQTGPEDGRQARDRVRNNVLSRVWSHTGVQAWSQVREGIFSAELRDDLAEAGVWVKEQAEDDNGDPR